MTKTLSLTDAEVAAAANRAHVDGLYDPRVLRIESGGERGGDHTGHYARFSPTITWRIYSVVGDDRHVLTWDDGAERQEAMVAPDWHAAEFCLQVVTVCLAYHLTVGDLAGADAYATRSYPLDPTTKETNP